MLNATERFFILRIIYNTLVSPTANRGGASVRWCQNSIARITHLYSWSLTHSRIEWRRTLSTSWYDPIEICKEQDRWKYASKSTLRWTLESISSSGCPRSAFHVCTCLECFFSTERFCEKDQGRSKQIKIRTIDVFELWIPRSVRSSKEPVSRTVYVTLTMCA